MPLIQCNFYSKSLKHCTNIHVVLPLCRRSEIDKKELSELYPENQPKLKTVFLLHGMYEDDSVWVRRTNIERYAEEREVAVVMPAAQNSYYKDLGNGQAYFTFLTQELPLFCRAAFPLSDKREENFIAGLSMGGYGAAKAALSLPDQYAAFASLSGALDVGKIAALAQTVEEEAMFTSVFGPLSGVRGGEDDLIALAQRAYELHGEQLPRAYLACGTEDTLCYPMNEKIRRHFDRIGISYTYEEGPGTHEWNFWDRYIQKALDFFLAES